MSSHETAQLETELIDLSTVPLDELAQLAEPELVHAIQFALAAAVLGGDERQTQSQSPPGKASPSCPPKAADG
ncbi:MAG TPA: hypothetical protein VFG87_24425 [Amycolatopsis sp.]|nr:hypothetical protein [Amycolatopsis sp.]